MNAPFIARSDRDRNFQNYTRKSVWGQRIMRDQSLSPRAKSLAHVLAAIADEAGWVMASNAELASLTGIRTPKTIIAARKELERSRYVSINRCPNGRCYSIVLVFGEGAQ